LGWHVRLSPSYDPDLRQNEMMSMARLLLVWVLLFAYAPPTAEAQTTDSGLGGIASTSTASVAKEMHAAIRAQSG
jgi:hypothetical protein